MKNPSFRGDPVPSSFGGATGQAHPLPSFAKASVGAVGEESPRKLLLPNA